MACKTCTCFSHQFSPKCRGEKNLGVGWACELRVRIADLERRLAEAEKYKARFEWYFGPVVKLNFVAAYLRGVQEGWTLDQWCAAIDAAMQPGGHEK